MTVFALQLHCMPSQPRCTRLACGPIAEHYYGIVSLQESRTIMTSLYRALSWNAGAYRVL